MRVLTMNPRARHVDWPARREALAAGLRELRPTAPARRSRAGGRRARCARPGCP
ncbi:hypothetical protein [Nonomuraea harbinensis]|uniref:Uncharacterized protein n=1 Tax=Nonomuraea harbinensis TaxID=1286938 RepID=A0ABW1BYH7_9ACTN|nr:hypothetical protein [Nonomuraea harbinensis]